MDHAEQRIDLVDYLLHAEHQTGIPASVLANVAKIGLIESALAAPYAGFGDVDLFPEFQQRAGILCSRLIRNHPLPDGNKRSALVTMIDFVQRNGYEFDDSDQHDVAQTIEKLAARLVSEEQFVAWVQTRISSRTDRSR